MMSTLSDIPVIDAHHHLWRRADLAWLDGPPAPRIFGEYQSIRRDYLADEYLQDCASTGVQGSVYVQTNWPVGRELEEVRWVQSIADQVGWPHAIVGGADLADAADLAQAFPDLQIVLLHAGMLTDRDPTTLAQWREGMQALAHCPNVSTKLSALSTFARRCSTQIWQPIVHETLAWFGPNRCMFGSNFPVEKLWTDYRSLFDVFKTCIDHLSIEEQRAVLHDTAARIYSLG